MKEGMKRQQQTSFHSPTYTFTPPLSSAGVRVAKMTLIDLAGSERAAATNNRGARMREGSNINKSLLALGNCINALACQ